jgi:phenylacetate-CoA ligase
MTDDAARAKSSRELSHHIKSIVGVSAQVVIKDPNSMVRSEGKAKRVVDDRPVE